MRDFKIKLNRRYNWEWIHTNTGSSWCVEAVSDFFPKMPKTAMAITLTVTAKKPKGVPHDRLKRIWVVKEKQKFTNRNILDLSKRPFVSDNEYDRFCSASWIKTLPIKSTNKLHRHFQLNTPTKVWVQLDVKEYDHEARYSHPKEVSD